MNIIIPYTNLNPLLPQLLSRYGFNPQCVDVSSSNEAYWELLKGIWERRETVIIIEHDILPWPGALEEMIACPAIWCAYSYDQNGIGIAHSFGCTKFTKELMGQTSTIWDEMTDHHWSRLDTQFEWLTFEQGIRPHQHRPAVIHLHGIGEYGNERQQQSRNRLPQMSATLHRGDA